MGNRFSFAGFRCFQLCARSGRLPSRWFAVYATAQPMAADVSVAEGTRCKAYFKAQPLFFTQKKVFIVWHSEAKKIRVRRLERMKQMLATGKLIS